MRPAAKLFLHVLGLMVLFGQSLPAQVQPGRAGPAGWPASAAPRSNAPESPRAIDSRGENRPEALTIEEIFVPALSFTRLCQSHVSLTNLRDTPVKIEVEGHAQTGGLAPLIGNGSRVWIKPGEVLEYSLQLEGNNEGAWFRIRERIPPDEGPAIAIRATTGCLEGDVLVTKSREAAVPLRNPWFAGRVAELAGVTVWAVNVSRTAARLDACYSKGSYYIIPGETPTDAKPVPICSHQDEFLLAPGAALRVPITKAGNSDFALRTHGDAILLEALRSDVTATHSFSVDSTITFQSAP